MPSLSLSTVFFAILPLNPRKTVLDEQFIEAMAVSAHWVNGPAVLICIFGFDLNVPTGDQSAGIFGLLAVVFIFFRRVDAV